MTYIDYYYFVNAKGIYNPKSRLHRSGNISVSLSLSQQPVHNFTRESLAERLRVAERD